MIKKKKKKQNPTLISKQLIPLHDHPLPSTHIFFMHYAFLYGIFFAWIIQLCLTVKMYLSFKTLL